MDSMGHYDLAVVGGGIAGLYCCLHAPAGMKIALFEATERVGGKIETVAMEGFQAEYGAMRFDPDHQPMVGRLLQRSATWPRSLSPSTTRRPSGNDGRSTTLPTTRRTSMPWSSSPGRSGASWASPSRKLMSLTPEELEELRRHGRHGSRPLWEQGLWNVLSDVLSQDAIKYIVNDGSFFHMIHENPGAVLDAHLGHDAADEQISPGRPRRHGENHEPHARSDQETRGSRSTSTMPCGL